MNRREFLKALAAGGVLSTGWPLAARAAEPTNIDKITGLVDNAEHLATELRRLLRIDRKQPVFGQDGACVGIPTGPDPGVHALAECN